MNRPASPLLHDYKPSAAAKPAKSRALWWFAVGLGIPLAGVALISGLGTNEAPPTVAEEPVLVAADSAPPVVENVDAADIIEDVLEPAPPPEPEYDRLTLKGKDVVEQEGV